jgi:transposase
MKTSTRLHPINSNLLSVTFDVGRDDLYAYTETALQSPAVTCHEEVIPNRNAPVIAALAQFKALASQHGFAGLCILCEPSGGFEKRLLRLARQAGHHTAFLNAESVKKLSVVQSNDASKSDQKDPRTMFLLAKLGKTLTHRQLTGDWLSLRQWHAHYEALDQQQVALRCQIQRVLGELFCEFSFKKDFLFDSPVVPHLVREFGLNPHAIVAAGQKTFYRQMKKHGVRLRTLERLWQDAERSVLQQLEPGYREMLELQLRQHFEDFGRTHERQAAARETMLTLLRRLQEQGQVKLRATAGLINEFLLARVLAQTGPLEDFSHWAQVLRYAGLNLCERQSGTVIGRRRISKKGRGLLRKTLSQAVLPRVRQNELYGPYYHAKKAAGMPGQKAMMAVARKFLKLLWGLNRSAQDYSQPRVFCCASQFRRRPTEQPLAQAA